MLKKKGVIKKNSQGEYEFYEEVHRSGGGGGGGDVSFAYDELLNGYLPAIGSVVGAAVLWFGGCGFILPLIILLILIYGGQYVAKSINDNWNQGLATIMAAYGFSPVCATIAYFIWGTFMIPLAISFFIIFALMCLVCWKIG